MARAKALAEDQSLYERDFCLWLERQAALLREGRFDELDLANLIEEIEAMARKDKKAIKSNLVVLLTHLLKHQFQPEQRSSSWRGSIVEHRQRLRDDFEESPSLRPHAAAGVRARLRRRPRAGERRDRAAAPRLPQVQPLHPGADPRSQVPAATERAAPRSDPGASRDLQAGLTIPQVVRSIHRQVRSGRLRARARIAPPACGHFFFEACSGLPLRLVEAKSSSWLSLMDWYIDLAGPFRSLTFCSPRLAASAAPAAFCCDFDLAGIARLHTWTMRTTRGKPHLFLKVALTFR